MKINKEIEEKAKDIIVQKLKEQENKRDLHNYITLCIEAGICPVCGSVIIKDTVQSGVFTDINMYCWKDGCNWTKTEENRPTSTRN